MHLSRLSAIAAIALTMPLAVAPQQPSTPSQSPQEPKAAATAPAPQSITQTMRKTVAFVTVFGSGNPAPARQGTGFFVWLEDKRLGENQGFGYLVTNRHVAQPEVELGTPHDAVGLLLRMNLKAAQGVNQSVMEPVPLGNSVHWYFPQDASVDLAVIPIAPDQAKYDYVMIPTSSFATEEQIRSRSIDVGDPVIFTGFFSSFQGEKRVQPIMRQGILALMPDETMMTTLHKPGRLYLADAHAFHGNSGSPIFVSVGGFRHGIIISGGEQYLLIGVISGYFPESAGYTVPAATVLIGEVRDNSGVASVVPAEELMKLLNSPELQTLRDKEAAKTKKP